MKFSSYDGWDTRKAREDATLLPEEHDVAYDEEEPKTWLNHETETTDIQQESAFSSHLSAESNEATPSPNSFMLKSWWDKRSQASWAENSPNFTKYAEEGTTVKVTRTRKWRRWCFGRAMLIVLRVIGLSLAIIAFSVWKIQRTISPHLSLESLPIEAGLLEDSALDEVAEDILALSNDEEKEILFDKDNINTLLSFANTDHSRFFVTFPTDETIRIHSSIKLPVLWYAWKYAKTRLNNIVEAKLAYTKPSLQWEIVLWFVWEKNITDSIVERWQQRFSINLETFQLTTNNHIDEIASLTVKDKQIHIRTQ